MDEVAELLVTGEALPTSHRVLTADGEVPLPAMVHPSHRGADLRARLMAEGVEFYGVRANPDQRVPVEILRDTVADQTTSRRAWLVRPSTVDGGDPVSRWLDEGFVSLPASLLPPVEPEAGAAALRRAVAGAYQHTSYPVRERLVADLDAFLRRMRPGDLVLAVAGRHGAPANRTPGRSTSPSSTAPRRSSSRSDRRVPAPARAVALAEPPVPAWPTSPRRCRC